MRTLAHAPFTVWPNCSEYMPMVTWLVQTFLTALLAPVEGIEPSTRGFGDRRSTIELH